MQQPDPPPKRQSLLRVWFALLAVTLACRAFLLQDPADWLAIVFPGVVAATAYLLLYCLLLRFPVWHLSLAWLALPLLLFAGGWLRIYWAVPLLLLWGYALRCAWQQERIVRWQASRSQLAGLLLVLAWAYFSGAGNYGHQSPDYIMHNGRLLDLVRESWPVHFAHGTWVQHPDYGLQHSYLVGYLAYYLPPALLGKLAGEQVAFEGMHLWTLAGGWLALLWLWRLAGPASGVLAAIALLLFGGWDAVGAVVSLVEGSVRRQVPFELSTIGAFFGSLDQDTGSLDFWPVLLFGYFFGGYLSNAAELFWSPHQTLAAWVCMGLLLQAFRSGHLAVLCFIYALLAFWSPMNMVATAVLPLCMVLSRGIHSVRAALTTHNVVAGGSMLLLFALYYLSGSAAANPCAFVWQQFDFDGRWWVFLLFHGLSWGMYAVAVASGWRGLAATDRLVFLALCAALLLLSLVSYGQYNDLLCRGITGLYFLLLVFLLQRVGQVWQAGRRGRAALLAALLLPGTVSGMIHAERAVLHHAEKVPGQSVADYYHGWEFLGRTDSFFVRYLSRETPVMSAIEAGAQP